MNIINFRGGCRYTPYTPPGYGPATVLIHVQLTSGPGHGLSQSGLQSRLGPFTLEVNPGLVKALRPVPPRILIHQYFILKLRQKY